MLINIWGLMRRIRKIQFALLSLLMIFTSALEVISISAVVPFLGVLSAPEKAFEYEYVRQISAFFKIYEPNQLLFPITFLFIVATFLAACSRILLLYCSTRLSFSVGADFSIEIYRRTLYQDYSIHIKQNSSEIINGIITKANTVISKVLVPALNFITSMVMIIGIVTVLIFINAQVAIVSLVVLGSAYALIAFLTKKTLIRNSSIIAKQSDKMVKSLQEGLGGIRDVLIDGSQDYYSDIYKGADLSFRRASGDNVFISSCPRYFMEGIGIIFIAFMSYILAERDSIAVAIPVLGALAVGAQKLLPALQQVYSSYTLIKGAVASLNDVIILLKQPINSESYDKESSPLVFNERIDFKNVSFQYSPDSPIVLKNINLTILKGDRIGIVGSTGGGKSTFIDLLMGLLIPTRGAILVDGVQIKKDNIRHWQKQIAHVPQTIYLTDGSVTENIAFGQEKNNIDMLRVKLATERAQLSDTVTKMNMNFDTPVGERGVQLSGGQRQRIGIARAIYKDRKIFVFDEATSALDNNTEKLIMKELNLFRDDNTMFIVAHRISTLKGCNRILKLEDDHTLSETNYSAL